MRSQAIGAAYRIISLAIAVVCALALSPASGKDRAETGAQCKNTAERLQAADLERFGIRFRVESAGDVFRMTLSAQSSICIQTSGNDCGTTTFEFGGARLTIGDRTSALETSRPNEYRYISRFEVAGNRLDEAELRLIYRGERCAAGEQTMHTFIVDLNNAVENAPAFFF